MNCAENIWISKNKNFSFSSYAFFNFLVTNTSFSKSIHSLILSFLVFLKNYKPKKIISMNKKEIHLNKLLIPVVVPMKKEYLEA